MKRLYQTWADMRFRCREGNRYNDRYFARGIAVCGEWQSWPVFREWALDNGYASNLEIDRENNDLGYSPANCRFVTGIEQNRNRDLKLTYASIRAAQTKRWAKPFLCIETGEIFRTQIEAYRRHKVDRKTLRLALSGTYTQAGGLHWKYVEASQ